MNDVHAELRRVAARARREIAKRFPAGAVVTWRSPYHRSVTATGEVVRVEHDGKTGTVRLLVRVRSAVRDSGDPAKWPMVGRVEEVAVTRATVAAPEPEVPA